MTDTGGSGLRPSERPPLSPFTKYGPLALMCVALLALLALAATGGVDGSDVVAAPESTTVANGRSDDAYANLPDGVEVFARARAEGRAGDIDWGERCDTSTGKVKLPLWPQPDCFKPFEGENGGVTETGVDEESIKVVVYLPQKDDPVLKFIYAQIGNNDTPDQSFATFEGFVEIFNRYYETYGRKVQLIRYDATGPISDPTAATADAETIARDIRPFFVIGGPNLTNAFADTLARNQIACIGCTPPQPAAWYDERSPYVWDVARNADQASQQVGEYIGRRLAGRPAVFAGDAAMHTRERVFGYVHVVSSDSSQELEDRFTAMLRDEYDTEFATIQTYGLPTELAGSGKDIITRLKEAGVTTVLFTGDPLGPQTLTRIATQQEYFPEWVLGQTVLVDTAVFSRTYDQRQWAHAFGPSGLFARTAPSAAGAGFLYEWYFDEPPPARGVALIIGPLQVIFGAVQGVGPNLTHERFRAAIFAAPIIPSTSVTPQVSFGNHGYFPVTDYSAVDDFTEVWWDADAVGPDEIGNEGRGLWRYVSGGKRWLPGELPDEAPNVFDPEGSVLIYDEPPAGAELPAYEPLR